ncbi:tail fiber assembly protein [Salmonella bongori]|uniref:tail fiber assembly protein n=1 Tax=Salmonella bongori TaxID=54736 RepID=UPI0021AC035C|nr:tail fiber assembly protein [Salmonella bongori]
MCLKTVADTEIAWRQDAVDAEIATADESVALIAWRKYRVLLMRVDTSKPVWPALPGNSLVNFWCAGSIHRRQLIKISSICYNTWQKPR